MKQESTYIELEKSYQLTKCIPYWISIFVEPLAEPLVEPLAIMKDMASGFDWTKPTKTIKFFSWKKP